MEDVKREKLTKSMRWELAEKLAEERLMKINDRLEDVKIKNTFYVRYGKRLLDIFIAIFVLTITLPINIIIGLITFFDVGFPIFFKQERTGKDGKVFTIIKFRNMTNERDKRGELLPTPQRVTKWGRFVRKTSLDELLNFWSILKGEMSVIGPRPLPPEYFKRYNKRHKCRLSVRPGLECPPRKLTENVWTWHEQFENDVWYVENVSLITDIKMCFNLVKFALDKKSAKARIDAQRGTFMGYDMEGNVINLSQIPQEYINKVFSNVDNSYR